MICALLLARNATLIGHPGARPLDVHQLTDGNQASLNGLLLLQTGTSDVKVPSHVVRRDGNQASTNVSHVKVLTEASDSFFSTIRRAQLDRRVLSADAKPEHSTDHVVEHVHLLNKPGFWWLMAVAILCISVVCIKMEASRKAMGGADADHANELPRSKICNFIFCFMALNVATLCWGISQEYMMTHMYEDASGRKESLTSSFTLVFFNRVATVLFCGALMMAQGFHMAFPTTFDSACPAATNLCASWCQYQSLAYVSFPLLTVTKSAKLLPVLVFSSLRGVRHSLLDYAEALLVVSALAVFGFETEYKTQTALGPIIASTKTGIMLLACGLFADSITPHLQDRLFNKRESMNVTQATFAMSLAAAGICFAILITTGDVVDSFGFFVRHPDAALHAFVLSMCSTLTQFMITYTIKHFGPVTLTIIATSRQLISVCLSAVVFHHTITTLAWIAAAVAFGTILARSVFPRKITGNIEVPTESVPLQNLRARPDVTVMDMFGRLLRSSTDSTLLICALGMCGPLALYSIAQEFMSIHTFDGELFRYPLFLIAMNRTVGALFALVVLYLQGINLKSRNMILTVIPSGINLCATYCQYEALYYIRYPVQSLVKSLKIIPVMLCGRILRNRVYSWLDYTEGFVITVLVGFFSWNFEKDNHSLPGGDGSSATEVVFRGFVLMFGYIFFDSFTSNVEDFLFQSEEIDPGQMLLGMQAISGSIAWGTLLCSGQLRPAIEFMFSHPGALLPVTALVLSEACGCYACMITVKIFGPAVFTLLLMAHQLFSLYVSVALFNHDVNTLTFLCLGMVCMLIITSSVRRVTWLHLVQKRPLGDVVLNHGTA